MPRVARVIPPEGFLHVISRGNNRRNLFLHPRDFKIYYSLLNKLKKEDAIRIFHYCLMPNHVHLLAGVVENSCLSKFMKRLNLKYFYYYSKKRSYVGHLWQGRFKSKLIEYDEYLIQCGKYIELNPVRANIVTAPQDYPFSSYHYYAFGREDEIIDIDPLYIGMGKTPALRQAAYRKMVINEIKSGWKI